MRKGNRFQKKEVFYRINRQITSPTVRLLDADGTQIGVVSIDEAIKKAEENVLDLVEIAPTAKPPVAKIIDYNKFLYQLKKKKQEEKKHTHKSETKQVQFGPFIDEHDLEIKLKRANEFIKDGDKVRFVVRFRGREMARTYMGFDLLKGVIEKMAEVAKVEREAKLEGRQIVMVMSKGATKKPEEEQEEKVENQAPTDTEVQVK